MNGTPMRDYPRNVPALIGGEAQSVIEQAGALCLRVRDGTTEVLLVSSLRTGRWGIPKGHIEDDESSCVTAERELFEEAGVMGTAAKIPIGSFAYVKSLQSGRYHVSVHVVDMHRTVEEYPEKDLRRTQWVSLDAAAKSVRQHGLRRILRTIQLKMPELPLNSVGGIDRSPEETEVQTDANL